MPANCSKQSILAPTAKIQPWWQAPKPPAEAGQRGGAMQVSTVGAMQVPMTTEKKKRREVPYRCHEKDNKEEFLGDQRGRL